MSFLTRIFGQDKINQSKGGRNEQAVIVHFVYRNNTDLSKLFELEDNLEKAISTHNAGEYDGNEIAKDGSDGFLYMYAPDADRLFEIVRPILKACTSIENIEVKLRYGAPEEGTEEKIVKL